METIKICIEPNEKPPLKEWHNETFTDSFFLNERYQIVKWDDVDPTENNFLFLYLVPDKTLDFLTSQDDSFWRTLHEKNIKLLLYNEQFNLFMRDGDIFKTYANLPDGKLDIRGYMYWQLVELCGSKGIEEKDLHFIHSADGVMQEIQQMRQNVIPWVGTSLDLPSKHVNLNESLGWGKMTDVAVKNDIEVPYMCLFAGRPAWHRHNLIKKLWSEDLTRLGKISLAPMPDHSAFGKISFDDIGAGPNQHQKQKGPYNELGVFRDTFLCVVGETYTPNGYAYFTEKTMKPILYERPFITYGNCGTLRYLHKLGFKTFNDFWDESYDSEEDDDKKLDHIVSIVKRIAQMSSHELKEMHSQMAPILKHNKNLLKDTDWGRDLHHMLNTI